MKNKISGLIVLVTVGWVGLGCGLIERVQQTASGNQEQANNSTSTTPSSSNKSITDRTIEQVADGETTGVPECDEVVRIFSEQMASPDDNWATKATKDFVFGQIKKSFRESLEQNKDDKTKLAQQCRDYKKQLDKAIREQNENSN